MREWTCIKCGHEVVASEKPEPTRWTDGHVCRFVLVDLVNTENYSRKKAEEIFNRETGLCLDDLPDGLPLEDFVDENGNLDYDGISAW